MPKKDTKPSQTWKTFLHNHVCQLVSVDFFTVPTIQLRVLYVFVVLAQDRRRLLHFNVTEHPTAVWAAQQIVEGFPEDSAPRYLIRDRDGIYGHSFTARVEGMGIEQVSHHRSESLAKLLRGAVDRQYPARVLEPRRCH
jgi:putative transposase